MLGNPNANKLRRRSLPDLAVEQLGRRIVRGDSVRNGGLPTETELSAGLGIGRNVLREAIKVLASKGLLEVLLPAALSP